MHERILEYAEQARLYAKSVFPHSIDDPTGWNYEYHKKFAELIVADCIALANKYAAGGGGSDFDVGYISCAEGLVQEFKEKFGVKE